MQSQYEDESDAIAAFWADSPHLSDQRIRYNGQMIYVADTRCAFVEWVDQECRAGRMSEDMAQSITLED